MGSSYQPIENYGVIGNMRTVALVGMDGSIDWLCLPHFDSPSVFAALLDDQKGGRFRIAPVGDNYRHKRFYWPDTAILVTRFLHDEGVGEIEDYMPVRGAGAAPEELIRRVRVVRGRILFRGRPPLPLRPRPSTRRPAGTRGHFQHVLFLAGRGPDPRRPHRPGAPG